MSVSLEFKLGYITKPEIEDYILRQAQTNPEGELASTYLQTNRTEEVIAESLIRAMLKYSNRRLRPDIYGNYIHTASASNNIGGLVIARTFSVEGEYKLGVDLDAIAAVANPQRSATGLGGRPRPQGVGKKSVNCIGSLIEERLEDVRFGFEPELGFSETVDGLG
jgi:hypothetical protein